MVKKLTSWQKKKNDFYSSGAWKRTRELIRKRDKMICQRCHKLVTEKGIVHHIKHLTPQNIDDLEISLNPSNLEFVCDECHKKIHDKGFKNKQKDSFVKDDLTIDYSKR